MGKSNIMAADWWRVAEIYHRCCVVFCLGFFVPLENFLLFTDTGETLQPLTSGRPFIMVIFEDLWHSQLLPTV